MVFINTFTDVFLDMSLYMLIGMILTGVLQSVMKKDTVARHLGRGSSAPSLKAAVLGVPLPLCSCGVLPTTVYLSQSGASTSAVMAFLISTPQTGVDSIIATFGMMGIVFAVYRPIAAFISGAAGGALIQKIAGDQEMAGEASCSGDGASCCDEETGHSVQQSFVKRIKSIVRYAFVEFIDDISVHFLIGVLIAAAIMMIIPSGFFESINLGSGIVGMLVMLAVGFPMYICSTSSIPIAIALMSKGISPGAAFVFLFAGPATNAASLSVLLKTLGKKILGVYLLVMAVCAVGFGLLLDALIGWFSLPMPIFDAQASAHGEGILRIVAGILFGAILLRSIAAKLVRLIKTVMSKKDDDIVLDIDGMSCACCAQSVKQEPEQCEGVKSADVDKKGKSICARRRC